MGSANYWKQDSRWESAEWDACVAIIGQTGEEAKHLVSNLSPNQCNYLADKIQELHEYFSQVPFNPACKQTVLQIVKSLEKGRCLIQCCASSTWLWDAVLKQEHRALFRILLQELCESVHFMDLQLLATDTRAPTWEWAVIAKELQKKANLDRSILKQDVSRLISTETDEYTKELRTYLHVSLSEERSRISSELPKYLFRDPDKVVQGRLIGEGAYASVYEAQWLGQTVATKAYAAHDTTFKTELPALFSLRHPNVVRLIGYTQRFSGGPFTLVMERMERDLHNLIRDIVKDKDKDDPPFQLDVAIDIILQIAKGMEFLHDHKVTHLDLKTANILVSLPKGGAANFYTAKLSDFGLAVTKLVSAQTKIPIRRAGTVTFMAPEIWDEENNASRKKADVYSFAMTCYEILTGRAPFDGYRWPATVFFMRVKEHNLRPTLPEDFPKCLSLLLQCCWHGRPEIRPTFKEIRNYLTVVRNVLSIGNPSDALPDVSYLIDTQIGNILNEEKQLAAMGTRDHHEAVIAALESLQKEAREKLKKSDKRSKNLVEQYIRDAEKLLQSVKKHKKKLQAFETFQHRRNGLVRFRS